MLSILKLIEMLWRAQEGHVPNEAIDKHVQNQVGMLTLKRDT